MTEKPGKVILRGITGRKMLDSKKGQREGFFSALLAFIVSVFFSIFFLMNGGLIEGSILCFTAIFSGLAVWAYNPRHWDELNIIYENGISETQSPFLPFSEITKIGYGTMETPRGKTNFIQIFAKNRDWKKCPTIKEDEFQNNYYEVAVQVLKEKCPDVPWVEMEWLEWKKK